MSDRKDTGLAPVGGNPFTVLRQLTSELDRVFDAPFSFRWPTLRGVFAPSTVWAPKIDVFEKENRLVTRVDLPGLKKEDVTVEVIDGHLVLSGERKNEKEEKEETFYRIEREYGRFYRAVPLPEGVKLEEVKATFADGVLEVSVPLPVRAEAKTRKIDIHEPTPIAKTAA